MRACRRCMLARARLHAPSAHATRKHCSLMSVSSPNTWQRPITPNPPPSAQRQLHQRTDRVKGVELHPTEPWCVRLCAQPMRDGQAGRDDGICCRCTRQCVSVCLCVRVRPCELARVRACGACARARAPSALPPPPAPSQRAGCCPTCTTATSSSTTTWTARWSSRSRSRTSRCGPPSSWRASSGS